MADWIASNPVAYPLLEAVHVIGIALLIGNLVLLESRVWGAAPELAVRPLARLALQIAAFGFAIVAASGLAMFASQPTELLANRAFQVKLALIAAAGVNAFWFHRRRSLDKLDRTARVLIALSSGLWVAVVVCGRWIAYR